MNQIKNTRSEYVANVDKFTFAPSYKKAPVKASKASGFTLGGILQGFVVLVGILIAVHYIF